MNINRQSGLFSFILRRKHPHRAATVASPTLTEQLPGSAAAKNAEYTQPAASARNQLALKYQGSFSSGI